MFRNKNVFITGSSGGIGSVIRECFYNEGANLYCPDIDELDLSSIESINKYIEKNKNIKFDVMVFCAGINIKADIDGITCDNLQKTFQVNLFSTVSLIQAFVGKMKSDRNGKIIVISSLYSLVSKEGRISYSSSKSGLSGLVRTLALELAPYDICINAVAPGYVMTEMTRKNLSEFEIEEIKNAIPTGRLQMPKEIADLVLFLSSDNNLSITGQIIPVDGGFLCR